MAERLDNGALSAAYQCSRRLWLQDHGASSLHPDASRARNVERGRVVKAAMEHLDGAYVPDSDVETLPDDVPAVMGAVFHEGPLRIATDALRRLPTGWELIGVRSAARASRGAVVDLAITRAVLEGRGVPISRVSVWTPSGRYVASDAADRGHLFTERDVTRSAGSIAVDVDRLFRIVAETRARDAEPDVATGAHCETPRRCPFADHCGATSTARADHRPPKATSEGPNGVWFDPAIRNAVDVARPVHFLDFEAFTPMIPTSPGTRPHGVLPYLWARVTENADGTVTETSWTSEGGDPRRPFATSLLEGLGDVGAIVVWSGFEADAIGSLAGALPDLAPRLNDVRRRIVDLHRVVRNGLWSPAFGGSTSLKRVAPVLCPDVGWDDLPARDGLEASLLGLGLHNGALTGPDADRWRTDLARYCLRDATALHDVWRAIRDLPNRT